MNCDEIFETGVSMMKTVWKKEGSNITRKKIQRVVDTDIRPRSKIEIKDNQNES